MSKEICVYMPTKEKNGFFNRVVVHNLSKELAQNKKISKVHLVDINKCSIVNGSVFYGDLDITKTDLFFWYAKGMGKRLSILQALANNIRVITDPHTFSIVNDKLKAHGKLRSLGIDVSEYALVAYDNFDMMKSILNDWKTLVIKPRQGSYGRGIIKIDDFDTLRDVAGLLEMQARKKFVFVEKFYPHTLEDWVSVVVVNFKALYGYRKKEVKFTDWKVFDVYKEGGSATEAEIEDVRNIAENAAKALDARIICFDILKTEDGYKIIDENNFPGLYESILENHKTTVAKVFADLIDKALA